MLTKEEKWFRRLERCMKAMPTTVEIAVTDSGIIMLPVGAVGRAFDKDGDVDEFDNEFMDSLQHTRIVTCSESL